jgi:4'-phosphopantetheinyl transferase
MTRGRPQDDRCSDVRGLSASLPSDELHVWRADLDAGDHVVARLEALLAVDERQRAQRFRFQRDRSRYIVGRGLLRVLLGRYLGGSPDEIRFAYGFHDKPALAGPGPHFNLSHSGSVALLAFSSGAELGIDVERDDADLSRERIPERFFSAGEVKALRCLPVELQPRAFLACWTRKESFIKARGDGLSLALDSFDVTLDPGQPAAILRTAWSANEPTEWSLMDLSDPQHGYIAAVASRGWAWRAIRRGVAEIVENEIVLDQEAA